MNCAIPIPVLHAPTFSQFLTILRCFLKGGWENDATDIGIKEPVKVTSRPIPEHKLMRQFRKVKTKRVVALLRITCHSRDEMHTYYISWLPRPDLLSSLMDSPGDNPGGSIRIFANSRNYYIRAKTPEESKVTTPPPPRPPLDA